MSIREFPLVLCILATSAGCASFRGIPSHGGGKRFDEEQRLIAAATSQALSQMQVSELRGKTVRISSEYTTTYGSGNANFGGLQDIGLSASYQDATSGYLGESFNTRLAEQRDSTTIGATFRYKPYMTFYTANANTDHDVNYFISCMEMKLRHEGAKIVPKGEEVTLFVLLDVLGTNLSRKDRLFNYTENLKASCEFTYYAVDSKTGNLIFEARRSGSAARYKESVTLFIGTDSIQRSVVEEIPLAMPQFHAVEPEASVAAEAPAKPPAPASPSPAKRTGVKPQSKPAAKPTPKPAPAPVATATSAPETPAVDATNTPPAMPASKEVPDEERTARRLEELGIQAKQLIQNGQSNQVPDIIRQIRSIDPNADELKEIAILLEDGK